MIILAGLHRKRVVFDVLRLTAMESIVLAAPAAVLVAQRPVRP